MKALVKNILFNKSVVMLILGAFFLWWRIEFPVESYTKLYNFMMYVQKFIPNYNIVWSEKIQTVMSMLVTEKANIFVMGVMFASTLSIIWDVITFLPKMIWKKIRTNDDKWCEKIKKGGGKSGVLHRFLCYCNIIKFGEIWL